MKNFYLFIKVILFFSFIPVQIQAQVNGFNLNDYKSFLSSHMNMSYEDLTSMYPTELFTSDIKNNFSSAEYYDSINTKYQLTNYEKSLLSKNGFVVSERLTKPSFGEALLEIFQNDLPVFISTDAILHAYHISYDRILREVEIEIIIDKLTLMLNQLHQSMIQLDSRYTSNQDMKQELEDVDVYITVALKLLGESTEPFYNSNSTKIEDILKMISEEKGGVQYSMFSDACVVYDFSQFKPRGHYADDSLFPQLARYFRTMMWLGRIEIYLLPPDSNPVLCPKQSFHDIQRQTIDAYLIKELFDTSDSYSMYQEIESLLKFFVGESDNVTLPNLNYLQNAVSINEASDLLDSLKLVEFQDSLKNQSFAYQKILSQILYSGNIAADSIVPASSFLLFGQRFVIDSYVTASVVFDRIKYNGEKICRLSPSNLDVMFALGNDASAQLLKDELGKYHYSTNLAALRYLVNSYDDSFWNMSLYNRWLGFIKTLNPPMDRSNLPKFMQTAAFWQEKLNTQLASWTQLRHDNLLYAKQSYTGGTTCTFPYTYIEPFPELYKSLKVYADSAYVKFTQIDFKFPHMKSKLLEYFEGLSSISDTLAIVAQKELDGTELDSSEVQYLKHIIYRTDSYSAPEPYSGWYARLFFNNNDYASKGFISQDNIVADIHTIPTDCGGNPVGWVKHVGTGDVNLAILTTNTACGNEVTFVGPVMSYYEYTTTNFQRLTDDDWNNTYLASAVRPDWVNYYMANDQGESRGSGSHLVTDVSDIPNNNVVTDFKIKAQNYPNPFNPSTIISFNVPGNLTGSFTTLYVFDLQGQLVKRLINSTLSANNYMAKWNGTNDAGEQVSSGVYIYQLRIADKQISGKMNLIK